jgi:hypothetical protein
MDFLYTINEEKVAMLPDQVIVDLHRLGYLKAIHLILASMPNMSHLIELKNSLHN